MLKLVNGSGQLGSALDSLLLTKELNLKAPCWIYHTWNFLEKNESIQKNCFEKFCLFVDSHKDERIIFISTYSEKENHYNFYKRQAEDYLKKNHSNHVSMRLPILIGKGVFQKMREESVEVYGVMEIMTVKDAAQRVLETALSQDIGEKIIRVEGELVSAKVVNELVLYGKKGILSF